MPIKPRAPRAPTVATPTMYAGVPPPLASRGPALGVASICDAMSNETVTPVRFTKAANSEGAVFVAFASAEMTREMAHDIAVVRAESSAPASKPPAMARAVTSPLLPLDILAGLIPDEFPSTQLFERMQATTTPTLLRDVVSATSMEKTPVDAALSSVWSAAASTELNLDTPFRRRAAGPA